MLLCTLFLAYCSNSPTNTRTAEQKEFSSKDSGREDAVIITPPDARVQSVISIKGGGELINTGEVRWYINDERDDSLQGTRITPGHLRKGDRVKAALVKGQIEHWSTGMEIRNTPPVIRNARILPPVAHLGDTLTVDVDAGDPDHDPVSYRYNWSVNNTFAGEENYLNSDLKKGDSVSVSVTPFDGEDYGKSVTLSCAIQNSLPQVSESTPSYDGKVYSYQIAATDPDGDKLSFSIEKGPEGMKIDSASGLITWEVRPDQGDSLEVKVAVKDGSGTVIIPFSAAVGVSKTD